ncbi:hypothetical protein ACODYM_29045 [Burkholderia gladioli]|uniref:hypothetical protein n=1 Tax=Burkholderia gladioli TaxID=28095 RepID=UPI003B502E5A
MKTIPSSSNNEPYACIFARREQSWIRLQVVLRRVLVDEYGSQYQSGFSGSCYVGRDIDGPYGLAFVFDASGSQLKLDEVQCASREMQRIERKLAKMNDELGYTIEFPEFCRRLVIAAGIKSVFVEHDLDAGAVDREGVRLSAGVFGLPVYDPKRQGSDLKAAARQLVNSSMRAMGQTAAEPVAA